MNKTYWNFYILVSFVEQEVCFKKYKDCNLSTTEAISACIFAALTIR